MSLEEYPSVFLCASASLRLRKQGIFAFVGPDKFCTKKPVRFDKRREERTLIFVRIDSVGNFPTGDG